MSRLAQAREAVPGAARLLAQLAVDNPGTVVASLAGMIVIEKAAYNLVRPRTAVEAAALCIVLSLGMPYFGAELVRRGALQLKLRDHHGCLVDAREFLLAGDANHADPAR